MRHTIASRDYTPRIRAARRKADKTAVFIVMTYVVACFIVTVFAVALTV